MMYAALNLFSTNLPSLFPLATPLFFPLDKKKAIKYG
jgi:hypothetical protein